MEHRDYDRERKTMKDAEDSAVGVTLIMALGNRIYGGTEQTIYSFDWDSVDNAVWLPVHTAVDLDDVVENALKNTIAARR